jgi:hypothetical protein
MVALKMILHKNEHQELVCAIAFIIANKMEKTRFFIICKIVLMNLFAVFAAAKVSK